MAQGAVPAQSQAGSDLPPGLLRDDSSDIVPPKRSSGLGLSHLAGFVGLLGGAGVALAYKREADDRYDRYLTTADPDRARALLDDAQRYDRRSVIGWVLAQASFVYLFAQFTKPPEEPLVPVAGEPVLRKSEADLQLGWKLKF